ncbi:hypothetical protein [Staphylococcus saprophyticus]|uniref:hypothetical protein n=1 Tax=Staphylococcus saprophyticus TaxID=29385 RepID=UPI0015F8CA66|nr:hypothetical protein [Staphylococcus saprophyticus]
MKKLLTSLSILAVVVVLLAAGLFGYSKYKEVQLKQEHLESQVEEKSCNEQTNNSNE